MSTQFSWQLDGLDAPRFRAFANLLSLRNGGQLDDPELSGGAVLDESDDDDNFDDNLSDAATEYAVPISDLGQGHLKKKFLDRFAEVVSREKSASAHHPKTRKSKNSKSIRPESSDSFVAAATLREYEDRINIYITRNNGLDEQDQAFFRKVELLFARLGTEDGEEREASCLELWNEIVVYDRGRISSHIPTLREGISTIGSTAFSRRSVAWASIRDLPEAARPFTDDESIGAFSQQSLTSYMEFARKKLEDFAVKLRTATEHRVPEIELHHMILNETNALRYLKSVRILLRCCMPSESEATRFIRDIALLGRIKAAHLTFMECIDVLPHFCNVKILPQRTVIPPRQVRQDPHKSLSLTETLQALSLPSTNTIIRQHINGNLNKQQVEKKFNALQRHYLPTHAEIQMILLHLSLHEACEDILPYMGCSKLACFLCRAFLQKCCNFETRGYHGRLFPRWTVPDIQELEPRSVTILTRALQDVQATLTVKLREPIEKINRLRPTSTADVTSVPNQSSNRNHGQGFTESNTFNVQSERALQNAWLRNFIESAQINESDPIFPPNLNNDSPALPEAIPEPPHEQRSVQEECVMCYQQTSSTCSGCGTIAVCSKSCEEKIDFVQHTFTCRNTRRPLDSADYLSLAIIQDELPDDSETLRDFGFSSFLDFERRSKLLGLYKGLMHECLLAVSHRKVHEWQVAGTLYENIEKEYKRLSKDRRGYYFSWFLENRHVIINRGKQGNNDQAIDDARVKVRPYLDFADRDKLPTTLPIGKRAIFDFYLVILNGWHPSPDTEMWYNYGFCTCTDIQKEGYLGFIYRSLIESCSFAEFQQAYEDCQLTRLMDEKGFRNTRQEFKHLEVFMSTRANEPRPSVWDLNQFCCTDGLFEPPRPVFADYGWMYCDTAKQRNDLKDVYQRLLQQCDPMDLHQACIAGHLFEFARGYLDIGPEFCRIMKNVYPLSEY